MTETELYAAAIDGMETKGRHKLANLMAHGYKIELPQQAVILNRGDREQSGTDATRGSESAVQRLVMHDAVKERVGIEVANCSTCAYLGSEDDGNYPECAVSWPVCEKFERYQYLKPFPFKTEQKCWEPEFWHSKFTDLIKRGEHEEVMAAIGQFVEARDSA